MIFLLLSADFMASDACFEELERAQRRQQDGGALVRLVLVRPADRDTVLLRQLPILPAKPEILLAAIRKLTGAQQPG